MLKEFRNDNKGAIYAWLIATIMIFAYTVVWFTAGWAVFELMDTVDAEIDLGDGDTTFDLLATVYAYHPFIVIAGFILYGIAHSVKRDVRIDFGSV